MMKKFETSALWGCFHREVRRFLHEPEQTIFNVFFSQFLFFIILFFLNRARVWSLIPGILIFTEFGVVFSNLKMTLFVGKIDQTLDYQLSSGIRRWKLYAVYVTATVLRSLIICVPMYVIFAIFFQHFNFDMVPKLLLWLVVTGIAFCNLSIFMILCVNSWNGVGAMESYVLAPLTYLSGCLFSIKQLSFPWRNLVLLNPVFHYFNVLNRFYIGMAEYPFSFSFIYGILFMVITTILCIIIFNRGYKILK